MTRNPWISLRSAALVTVGFCLTPSIVGGQVRQLHVDYVGSQVRRQVTLRAVGFKALGGVGGAVIGATLGGVVGTVATQCAMASEDCTGVKISAVAMGTIGMALGVSWVANRIGENRRTLVTFLAASAGLGLGLLTNAGDPGFEPQSPIHGVFSFAILPLAGALLANTLFQ